MSIATRRRPDPAPTPPTPLLSEPEAAEALIALRRSVESARTRLDALADDAPLATGLSSEEAASERQILTTWLDRAQALIARFVTRRGESVREVVVKAGGAEDLGHAVRAGQLLVSRWWQTDEAYGTLKALETELGGIDRQLGLIGENSYHPAGSIGETLTNDQTRLRMEIQTLRGQIDTRRAQETARTIERASAGDVPALETLLLIVTGRPDAFSRGLGASLGAALNDAALAREALDLVGEQEQRRLALVALDRARAFVRRVGYSQTRSVRALLAQAIAGDEFAGYRCVRIFSDVHGFAGDTPVPSPREQLRLARLLLDLADIKP
jgi:hypothetical protein